MFGTAHFLVQLLERTRIRQTERATPFHKARDESRRFRLNLG